MKKKVILLADNEERFREAFRKLLNKQGYKVIIAKTPKEALRILQTQRYSIDLAILDLRLKNDKDDKDLSGLDIAKRTDSLIPKIIISAYPTFEAAREALGPSIEQLPPAVYFLDKNETSEYQMEVVRDSFLTFQNWFLDTQDQINRRLAEDYDTARKEASTQFKLGILISMVFVAVIVAGIVLALKNQEVIGSATVIAGTAVEICNFIFFARIDKAHERVDRFHYERIQAKRIENSLAATDRFLEGERQQDTIEYIIKTSVSAWLKEKPDVRSVTKNVPSMKRNGIDTDRSSDEANTDS